MKKPLCLWWRGDEHGSCGLLHNWLTRGALAGIRRGCLLSRRAKDSYLQWQSDGEITFGGAAGKPLHIYAPRHPHIMKLQNRLWAKAKEDTYFSQGFPRGDQDAQKEEVQTNHNIHIYQTLFVFLIYVKVLWLLSPSLFSPINLDYSFCFLFISCLFWIDLKPRGLWSAGFISKTPNPNWAWSLDDWDTSSE